jgi:hypothetical protein
LTTVTASLACCIFAASAILLFWNQPARAAGPPRTVLSMSGSGNVTTRLFPVASEDWDLRWRYDCKGPGSLRDFQLTVGTVFTSSNRLTGMPSTHRVFGGRGSAFSGSGPGGEGSHAFANGPAQYYLVITTACAWSVSAVERGPRPWLQRFSAFFFNWLPVFAVAYIAWQNVLVFRLAWPGIYWAGGLIFGAAFPIQSYLDPGGTDIGIGMAASGMLLVLLGVFGVPPRVPPRRVPLSPAE